MTSPLYQFSVRRLNGRIGTLEPFRGLVLLIVNVASSPESTQHSSDLERIHRNYSGYGFSVLGFPTTDFATQEPGEGEDLYPVGYDVRFPMFERIAARGPERHPLYAHLTTQRPLAVARPGSQLLQHLLRGGYLSAPPAHGEILWNFEKFLVSRTGEVVARFAPDLTVDQPVVLEAIERELHQPRPAEPFPLPLVSAAGSR